jgi:hypothetical protein
VSARRPWTEDELALAYWALPILRVLSDLTGREFASIAMKLANLLFVDTDGAAGLANASQMDRAIVKRYQARREDLERRVVEVISSGSAQRSRATEIGDHAASVLHSHGTALHLDVIAMLLASRNPLWVASRKTLEAALRQRDDVVLVGEDIWAPAPAN